MFAIFQPFFYNLAMFSFVHRDIDFAHKLDYASSPKDEYGKHMHPFFELIYFVSGDVEYSVDGEKKKLRPGDFVLIQPGKFHFAEVNRDVLYERYVLKAPLTTMTTHIQRSLFERPAFYRLTNEEISIFKSLDSYYARMQDDDMYIICLSKLLELFALLNVTKQRHLNDDESVVSKIVHYIEKNIDENITLTSMSVALSYSESYISNSFKKEMHIPIMKYIRSKKIIYAHSLIQNGEKPQNVSQKLNFSDYSTFYRQYLKVIGIPPSKDK